MLKKKEINIDNQEKSNSQESSFDNINYIEKLYKEDYKLIKELVQLKEKIEVLQSTPINPNNLRARELLFLLGRKFAIRMHIDSYIRRYFDLKKLKSYWKIKL